MKRLLKIFNVFAICVLFSIIILPQESIIKPEEFLNSINREMLYDEDYTLNNLVHYFNIITQLAVDNPKWSDWLKSDYTLQNWNGATWNNDSSEVYTYNEYSILSEILIRDWSSSQWLDKQKYFYYYNASLALSEDKFQYYSGGIWVDSIRNNYTYNPSGQLSIINTYVWNNSVWENYELATSTYNNYQLTEELFQVWNGNGWDNSGRNTYTYDANSVNITSAIWLFGSWVNVLRVSFYYNNIGLIVELRLQYWDFFSGWVNLTHLLFTYDNDYNIIEGLWQDWDTGTSSWINYSRTTSTYRSGNIPLNDLTELWIENTWIFDSLRSYEFDNNSNLSYIINQKWNGTWINYTRELFAYITDVGDEDNYPLKFELKQNYPNPFNPRTSIQYAVSSRQFVSLKVYDILGNEVAILVSEEKAPGSYEVSFNAAEFGSGVYIYSLRAGSFAQTRKMMLIK